MQRRYPFIWLGFMFLGALTLGVWFPFLPQALSLGDVRSFAPDLLAGLAYAALFSALYVAYLVVARAIRQGRWSPTWPTVLTWTTLIGLPLIVTYPINAIDVYNYYWLGRLVVHYHVNPFVMPPAAFPHDPYLPLMGEWANTTTPYGPVWALVSALIYWLAQGEVATALVLFKLVGLVALAATGYLLWCCLAERPPAERWSQTALWLWNPALLFMFVIDAHNDALMLLWLVAGVWLIQRRRPVLGLTVMALAPLTKLIGVLVLPFMALYAWQQLPPGRPRLRLTLGATLGMGSIALLLFAPFGSPLPLLQRLATESQEGGSFSPLVFVILAARALGGAAAAGGWVRGASWLFATGALGLVVWFWWGRRVWRVSADIFALYLLTAFRFRIWYPSWLLPWLILDDDRPRLAAGLAFLLTSQLSVVWYGHIWAAWLGGDHVMAHLIGVPLVFGPPLAVWWAWPRPVAVSDL